MEELLKQISELEYGITGSPLIIADILQAKEDLSDASLPLPPDEFWQFLTYYNGFKLDDRCLFGIDNHHHFLHDLLGENLASGNPYQDNITLLGETSGTYVAWVKDKRQYCIIDKSSFMVLHRLKDFAATVRYILKIDD